MRVVEYVRGIPIYELSLEDCRDLGQFYPCYGCSIYSDPDDNAEELEFVSIYIENVRERILMRF